MNKLVAIAELKSKPVMEFLKVIRDSEIKKRNIGDLLNDVLLNVEYRIILNIFLGFSKRMLRSMSGFYLFDWSDYIDRFIDHANEMRLLRGGFDDSTIRSS